MSDPANVELSELDLLRRYNRQVEQRAALIAGAGWPDDPIFDGLLRRAIYGKARRQLGLERRERAAEMVEEDEERTGGREESAPLSAPSGGLTAC